MGMHGTRLWGPQTNHIPALAGLHLNLQPQLTIILLVQRHNDAEEGLANEKTRQNMTGGIVKANMQTSIPSIPPLLTPPDLNSGMTNESQGDQSKNSSGDTVEECIQWLEAQLRKFQMDHAKYKQAFQCERETLNGSISALEARLVSKNTESTAESNETLLTQIATELIAAATAAALASLTANTPPTKTNKKHALSAANYVSAEAVKHSGIIPEIVLRTAQKGFFIPFANLTAMKYHNYQAGQPYFTSI
ncbi:hypothetical protein BS47DRAFT_1368257 [Hydnum rufescens UP504]|uniref:Uncharacterized protein n=1 Tax=Hydnum rufescens UP504 TaxID=1448309 RepID=A0A9P6AFY4_9AGAM|nr:hypothetical protein BS47DRAFT_1368257 [Hydnum rufescens UP504]